MGGRKARREGAQSVGVGDIEPRSWKEKEWPELRDIAEVTVT